MTMMPDTTVNELANSIKVPVERLLKEMQNAGLSQTRGEDLISEEGKQKLLNFLKENFDDEFYSQKIILQSNTETKINNDLTNARKIVNEKPRKNKKSSQPQANERHQENNFNREELTLRLEKIAARNRPVVSLFAARCVLRVIPLIAQDQLFSHWMGIGQHDKRAHYLLSLWRGILSAWVYDEFTANKNASLANEAASALANTPWKLAADISTAATYVNASVHMSIAAAGYAVHFARLAILNSPEVIDFDNANQEDLALIENGEHVKKLFLWTEFDEHSKHVEPLNNWRNSIENLADQDEMGNEDRAQLVRKISAAHEKIYHGDYSDMEAKVFLKELNSYFSDSEYNLDPKESKPNIPATPHQTPFKFTASRQQAAESISDEDHLNRKKLVETLASFLAHPANYHHQTLGLLGDWGVGKSSFIHLLKESIVNNHPEQRFLFGEFNAWAYENTDNLQAGIAQEMIKALVKPSMQKNVFSQWWWSIKLKSHVAVALHGWFKVAMLLLKFLIAIFPFSILSFYFSPLPITKDHVPQDTLSVINEIKSLLVFSAGVLSSIILYQKLFWNELKSIIASPQAKELLTYLRLPDYAKHLGEIPVMRKTLEKFCRVRLQEIDKNHTRLLFVVDDLDRCTPNGIVKVLEAVRLVLDIKNVMVVIAVDQRIALSALALHYKDFAQFHNSKDSRSIARDYLAKVIHLPITLHKPRGSDVEAYLKFIWSQMITEEHKTILEQATPPAVGETALDADQSSTPDDNVKRIPAAESNAKTSTEKALPVEVTRITTPEASTSIAPDVQPESTVSTPTIIASLSSDHQKAFLYWLDYFELSNPRQVKRLNNSYNLLHSYYDYDAAPVAHGLKEPHKTALIFPMMIALFIMEYLNTLDDQTLRIKVKAEFRKPAPKKGAAKETIEQLDSTLFSADIILAIRKLNETANTDLIKIVEPFVLPAIECH